MTVNRSVSRVDTVIDRVHAAAAATTRHEQQRDALMRSSVEVRRLEAQLASARAAQQSCLVLQVRENGWPVSLAADAAGVSRESAHKWLRTNS